MSRINFELLLPDSLERVWESLTNADELARWLMPNDFEPHLGGRFSFFDANGNAILCRITDLERNELLAYWWDDGESGQPSIVVWKLDPTDDGGTRLRLLHEQVETPEITMIERKNNWEAALGRMVPVVFMSAEEEMDPNRVLIGLRDRTEVTA